MDKSEFLPRTLPGCGCSGSGLGSSSGYQPTPCGCGGGLGDPAATQDQPPTQTHKDLIAEAKKYINGEIPLRYKLAAGVGIVALLLLATRGT